LRFNGEFEAVDGKSSPEARTSTADASATPVLSKRYGIKDKVAEDYFNGR
jgi:hypothetical protein